MKRIFLFLFLLPVVVNASTKLLSGAEIRVITCGPYQGELYSAFGHSAIYVKDARAGVDVLYNYGVFDYEQPNFYLNFAKGHLNYRLATMNYDRFVASYISENRFVHEQVLNLSQSQAQRLYDFLDWNAEPENMYYYYDYFYDNCATRIRDGLTEVFGDSIGYDSLAFELEYSIRDLCDLYLQQQPWGDLGIDLCLGLPMDKKASYWMCQFLPDYLESSLNDAFIKKGDRKIPLVKSTKITYESRPEEVEKSWNHPMYWMMFVLILGLIVSIRDWRAKNSSKWFDVILFGISGLLGVFLLLLWLVTDHAAAAYNFNLVWALPTHLAASILIALNKRSKALMVYFGFSTILGIVLLLSWSILPQALNNCLIPLSMILTVRSFIQFHFRLNYL